MLFGHGDDFYNTTGEVKINFSSNVWHGASLDKLKDYLVSNFNAITHYPEPDAASLRRLLTRRHEMQEENVLVTNGSVSAFYLVAQAFRGARSIIAVPSFVEYEDACRLHEHTISFFQPPMTSVIFLWKDKTCAGLQIPIIRTENYYTVRNYYH